MIPINSTITWKSRRVNFYEVLKEKKVMATMTKNSEFLCSVKERGFPEDFSSLGCCAVLGKGGEWVMTTTAGEPMILPYDPPAGDPQSETLKQENYDILEI